MTLGLTSHTEPAELDAMSAGVLVRGGLQAARAQLLVGFDPAALYLGRLEQRFGHLGTFCAGLLGSCAIAVRWRPEVRLALMPAERLHARFN